MSSTRPAGATYPGQRLGLPAEGPGAVAGWGRRLVALAVDWVASLLVAGALAGHGVLSSGTWRAWLPMLVFLVESGMLVALLGGSFGQLALRVAVVRLDRRPVSLLRSLLRALLVCLVVPPLVFNRDQRGLHDLATGTITVRR